MNETNENQLKEYLKNVNALFVKIENWSVKRGLEVNRSRMEISEEEYGTYKIEKLILTDAGCTIAEIVPVGCSIVGFAGRVDIAGPLDSEALVYTRNGGPYITQSEEIEGKLVQTRKTYFYRSIKDTGWYWIESTRIGRAKKFDEALFFDLLAAVSNYARA